MDILQNRNKAHKKNLTALTDTNKYPIFSKRDRGSTQERDSEFSKTEKR